MTHQVQLDLYEMHTGRRGAAGVGGGTTAATATAVAASQELSHLVRPLEYHVQGANIPCGEIPHFDNISVFMP